MAPATDRPTGATFTLDEALTLAEEHSLQLKIANLQVPKARAAMDKVRQAADAGGAALARALEQRYGVPLPANETTAAALRRGGEIGLQQAILGLDATRLAVRLGVTRAYLEWQTTAATAAAQGDAVTRARAQAANARAGVAAGSAAPYDVLQADAQVAAQAAAASAADAGRDSARLALERALGTPLRADSTPDVTADVSAGLPDPVDAVDERVEQALQQRPDIALANLVITARQADLALLTQYLPAGDPALVSAALAVQEAALQLDSARQDTRTQVRQAWLALNSARERLSALHQGEAQAREALRLARVRFDAGAATTLEVVAAQATLSLSAASRIQAAADAEMARASLRQAMGDL